MQTREEFADKFREMCTKAGHELYQEGLRLYDKLTSDELASMAAGSLSGASFGYLMPKIILCALPAESIISTAFAAEATLARIKKCRRIHKNRQY